MTEQEKDILLEKMLDPGAVLTDEEIGIIMSDEELRGIYDVSSALRGACVQPSVVNVEREWRLFRHKILPKPSRWRWAMRVAAIFLGVLVVSAIVKVAVDRNLTPEAPVLAEVSAPKQSDVQVVDHKVERSLIESEEAARPASRQAVRRKRTASRPTVVVETVIEDIDVDEYLRIQQAGIDNDVALMQSQLYIDELQALRGAELPGVDADDQDQSEVRYIITQ